MASSFNFGPHPPHRIRLWLHVIIKSVTTTIRRHDINVSPLDTRYHLEYRRRTEYDVNGKWECGIRLLRALLRGSTLGVSHLQKRKLNIKSEVILPYGDGGPLSYSNGFTQFSINWTAIRWSEDEDCVERHESNDNQLINRIISRVQSLSNPSLYYAIQ